MTFVFAGQYSFSYYCGCSLAPVYKLTQLILGFGRSPKGLFPFCREPSLKEVLDQYLGIGESLRAYVSDPV